MFGFSKNSRSGYFLKFFFIPLLIFAWVFSGWPQIWNFPPKVQEAQAALATQHASAFTSTTGFNANFSSPENAYSSDNIYASVTDSKPRNKEFATNFRGFDFSSIPTGSTINSVTVYIEKKSSGSNTSGEWRTSMWEDVTVSAALTSGAVGAIGDLQYTSPSTNTTDAYWSQSWGTLPTLSQLQAANFGVRAQIAQGNSSTVYTYYVDDVYIVVDYTAQTSPAVVLNTIDANDFGSDTTPTLEFTGTDSENDAVRYNIQIDDSNDCLSPILDKVSGTDVGFAGTGAEPYTSGVIASYTVQLGEALSSGTYYWRARGIDPGGSNTYGSFSSIRSFTVTAATISITLDTDGAVAYGTIGQNSTKDTTTGGEGVNDTESVQNTGNANENFTIEGASTAAWTLTTAAVGSDTYNHSWCTATCDTTPTWNPFDATPEALASAVAPAASQTFDLQIHSPNPSTVFTQQTANVTITASAS